MIALGLGSNCGDRLRFLRKAIHQLKSPWVSPRIEVKSLSPIYESDALLPEGAPPDWNRSFLNLALICETSFSPSQLLAHIKRIENSIGRIQRGRWAPREIDIDILAFDSLIRETEELNIPHRSLMERPFVMLPFADLVPHWRNPGQDSSEYSIGQWVAPWKRKPPESVPFQTRRSTHTLTELVGIINVTPDSFSDGGAFLSADAAFAQANRLISQGARILDVGAESTRPGATPVSPNEEWNRLHPVVEALQSAKREASSPVYLSIDTRHSDVATQAIQMGADWINDVSGFENPEMCHAVLNSEVDLVMMHSLSVPPRKGLELPPDCDPISVLLEWAEKRIAEIEKLGIARERIIFDPGIGFGKTPAQSWEIFRRAGEFQKLGTRILVGHSRKSFLSSLTPLTDLSPESRDFETIAITCSLAKSGVDFLRVHHIEGNSRGLKAWSQIDGVVECGPTG